MTTKREVLYEQAQQIHAQCVALGMITPDEGWETTLDIGSKVNGRAYRLALTKAPGYGHYRHPAVPQASGFLGMTAREAHEALAMVLGVLWSVRNAQKEPGQKPRSAVVVERMGE